MWRAGMPLQWWQIVCTSWEAQGDWGLHPKGGTLGPHRIGYSYGAKWLVYFMKDPMKKDDDDDDD